MVTGIYTREKEMCPCSAFTLRIKGEIIMIFLLLNSFLIIQFLNISHRRTWRSPRLQRRRPARRRKRRKKKKRRMKMTRTRRRRMTSPALSQTTARRKWTSSYPGCNARARRAKTGTKQQYLIETHTHSHSHTHTFCNTSILKPQIRGLKQKRLC